MPTGVLDEATAWRALSRHALGLERRDPDLAEWLRWAASEPGRAAYLRAPEDLRRLIRELDGRGGQMTAAAFAARIGLPPSRLPGFIAQLQRLLNLDGYPILDLDRDRNAVTLDVAMLKRQFELE